MGKNILSIDQGTTNTKALIIDPSGSILGRGSRPTSISYPRPGWVEQDAEEVWLCTRDAIDACLGSVDEPDLAAVAVSNQRETALVWERNTGKPVGPCVVWQCRRTTPFCTELKEQGLESFLQERTGLQVDSMFSASKIRWILRHIENGLRRAQDGELCVGNIDSWLLWNLTGGATHATDMTNASRTQLLNLRSVEWDQDLLDIFAIPRPGLPEIRPSSHIYGETIPLGSLPGGLPVACLIGDSHASLYALGGFRPGSIKATYGTGSSLMTTTSGPIISRNGLSTTIGWARDEAVYALEGNIYATGAAVDWLGGLLGLDDPGPDIEELAGSVEGAGGVYFVPAFVGLGAPHWNESARGVISGLEFGVGAGEVARATLEAIAYQVRDVYDVMQIESGVHLETLLADGGASRNDLLVQFQADILGCPVLRSSSTEGSPLGAAFLAGLAIGLWADEATIESMIPPRDRFEPRMGPEQREAIYSGWKQAVARALFDPVG